MKDNGRTDFWAPDSSLEGEKPGVWYQNSDGKWFNVRVNDFVDLDEVIPEDPIWGSSFQVLELLPNQVVVRFYDPIADLYGPINIDIQLIMQNYQLSPLVDELLEGAIVL